MVQFYFWFKFYFPLFFSMVMYDNEFETEFENEFENEFEDFKGKGWGYVLLTGITLQGFITSESGNQILQFQKKKQGN